jgi:hypothetical protein
MGSSHIQAQDSLIPESGDSLSVDQVSGFADLALKGMDQEFPNKPANVITGPETVLAPRQLFPAFYGCFDWHSSIHGHWMLVRLVRLYPQHPRVAEIRQRLAAHLTAENLAKEAAFFEQPHNKSFERMYGWAWAFRLIGELEQWNDDQGNAWRENLRPLENVLVERVTDYLPRLEFPIRTGVHPDSGFALGQILDYARIVKNAELASLVTARARDYYLNDRSYPSAYEPSGEDFFSSGLNEADLMRRVLDQDEFARWLTAFMPDLDSGRAGHLLTPVEVSDVTDGKLVHLAGLDFSRSWSLQGIAAALPAGDSRRPVLNAAAAAHAKTGFNYVFSGHYEGEHWLATFAVYTLTQVGIGR